MKESFFRDSQITVCDDESVRQFRRWDIELNGVDGVPGFKGLYTKCREDIEGRPWWKEPVNIFFIALTTSLAGFVGGFVVHEYVD